MGGRFGYSGREDITLKAIKASQEKLNKMIDEYEKRSSLASRFSNLIPAPEVLADEKLVHTFIPHVPGDSMPYHLILLDELFEEGSWGTQSTKAIQKGAALPRVDELLAMHQFLPKEFSRENYWTADRYKGAVNSHYSVSLCTGDVYSLNDANLLVARFVRRSYFKL